MSRDLVAGTQKPKPVAKRPAVAKAPLGPLDDTPKMPAVRWARQAILLTPSNAKALRRHAFFVRIGVFVLLPTLLAAAYVYLYATPRYVSEFQIIYQSNSPGGATSTMLASIPGAGGTDMSQVVQTYLTSATAAQTIDKELEFRQHYTDKRIDWLDRLPADASAEQYLAYFNRRIVVSRQFGGYVTVDVEAFDPDFAQRVGNALIKHSEKTVAAMLDAAHTDAVKMAEDELKLTEKRLRETAVTMTNFRNKHSDVNIQTSANSQDTVVSALEAQVSSAASDLSDAKAFLSKDAPSVIALQVRLDSLKAQIVTERKRLGYIETDAKAKGSGKLPYSQVVADFSALQTEDKFATDSYISAKNMLDLSRELAAQKAGYIMTFVAPNLPQASTSPNGPRAILATLFSTLFLYMTSTLAIGLFRERARA